MAARCSADPVKNETRAPQRARQEPFPTPVVALNRYIDAAETAYCRAEALSVSDAEKRHFLAQIDELTETEEA